MQDILYDEENQHMLEPFLVLLMNSEEYRLSNIIGKYEDFEKINEVKS